MAPTKMEMAGFTTRLPRVQTPSPRVVVLTPALNAVGAMERQVDVRVVVQIRPKLLHFVQNGKLMGVMSSETEICALAECHSASMGIAPQLLVATIDGSLWLVRLPSSRQNPTKPVLLQETRKSAGPSTASSAFIRRVAEVPGVQQLRYVESLDAVVCASLLTPTTIVRGVMDPKRPSRVEIDELEGEQSTCVSVMETSQQGDVMKSPMSRLGILQGDTDGFVRLARLTADWTVDTSEVLQLGEPVLAIFPVPKTAGLDVDALVVGARGSVALFSSSQASKYALRGRLCSTAVAAAEVLHHDKDPKLIFMTTEKATHSVLLTGLVTQLLESAQRPSKSTTVDVISTVVAHANLQDVVSLGSHASVIAFLTRSGLLISLPHEELCALDESKSASEVVSIEHRVKSLLQEIGSLSLSSNQLQNASRQTDSLLKALNSALLVRRLVESNGIEALATCPLRMKLVASGWAMQTKSVHLRFTFQPSSTQTQMLLDGSMWRISIFVRAGDVSLFSYSFDLSSCFGVERTIELDQSVLHQLEDVIVVSGDLVFIPAQGDHDKRLTSFAVQVIKTQRFHLLQLCQPVAEFPSNPNALRDLFRQDHEFLAHDDSDQPRQGLEWWWTIKQFASDIGVLLPPQDTRQQLAGSGNYPLRFVLEIPKAFGKPNHKSGNTHKSSGMGEDDVLALLTRIFNIERENERDEWKAACRVVGGKWWVGMRNHAGNLIVLRLAPTVSRHQEDEDSSASQDRIEVTVQSSSVSDLSAMRALIVHAYGVSAAPHSHTAWSAHEVASASLALNATRDELRGLAATAEEISHKLQAVASEKVLPIDLCQEEWLQLLQRVAQGEMQCMDLYWKSREVVNQWLTL